MQKIRLDFADPTYIPTLWAMQGDIYSRFVAISLYYDGEPYTIPEDSTFKVTYQMRGGLEGSYDTISLSNEETRPACVADSNVLTVELAEILTVDGNAGKISVSIIGTDGSKLHTWKMTLICGEIPSFASSEPTLEALKNTFSGLVMRASNFADNAEAEALKAKESAKLAAASEPAQAAERAEIASSSAKLYAEKTKNDALVTSQNKSDCGKYAYEVKASRDTAVEAAERAEEASKSAESVATSGNPVGTVIMFAGTVAPNGYLICNGAEVSRETYSKLFDAIGIIYGEGDGTTTFNLPDVHGKYLVGDRLFVGRSDVYFYAAGTDHMRHSIRFLPCIKY